MNRKDDPRNPLNEIKRNFADYKRRLIAFLWTLKGRFLSNTHNPYSPFAESMHIYSFEAFMEPRARRDEWYWHMKWITDNILDRPKGTSTYTVEQLEKMELVGLYQPLLKTLSSIDQIGWWIFGMKKPTVEKFLKRVRSTPKAIKTSLTNRKNQVVALFADFRLQLANAYRYLVISAQTLGRVPVGLAVGDYVRPIAVASYDKSWIDADFLLKSIELPYLIVSDPKMGESWGYENFKKIRLDLREYTAIRVDKPKT